MKKQLHTHNDAIIDTLGDSKQRTNTFLEQLFTARIAQAHEINPAYAQLWQTMATLSAVGGKRLRPYMTILGYTINSNDSTVDAVIPAAAAQELLHLALLIHDDIIDRDDLRYGIKNITGQYDDLYASDIPNDSERRHFSNSAAIIAGDLLISEAYRLLQQCSVDDAYIAKAQTVLADAIFAVAGGELLDTESTFRRQKNTDALTIAQQKTASYSFVSPLTMGAHLAGAPAHTIETLTAFANALGVAYQLQDDLLGVFGDEAVTGKSTAGDIIEGKRTYLIEQFHTRASTMQKQLFEPLFNNKKATPHDLDRARQLLVDSGAKRATEQTIESFVADAKNSLEQLQLSDTHFRTFTALIERCIHRRK